VRDAAGIAAAVEHVPYEREYRPGFEDTRRRVPDVSKAERLLGFRAAVALEDGLRRTIDWWRQRLVVPSH
jgi:UDP-glucose 4-epimerase